MVDVTLDANFTVKAVAKEVRDRARAVEERVVSKMVDAAVGTQSGEFVRIKAKANAVMIYRMTLAMHAALAEEGIVTYTGAI